MYPIENFIYNRKVFKLDILRKEVSDKKNFISFSSLIFSTRNYILYSLVSMYYSSGFYISIIYHFLQSKQTLSALFPRCLKKIYLFKSFKVYIYKNLHCFKDFKHVRIQFTTKIKKNAGQGDQIVIQFEEFFEVALIRLDR